ncbi:ferredoxin [Synechococcus sp. PCC 7502]|uniref:(2Fe-2S) ferredoxin domain-containing protein n=1 Tax=Synechococcus sp. PCC 7502 TaxID=1173263 RepID=UPI00029F8D2C|nr:(2Fe-2S) ferredoxin domain-containing protein [Synechococcus sp. PCC 7502]AFY74644.1 ferredoxin [Synechococcus sp. PCC 7502]
MNLKREVLVCQHRTCFKDGAAKVLQRFKLEPVDGVMVIGCGCLGLCGSGPIVLVADQQVYYWHVKPQDVPVIVKQHLRGGKVIKSMLHKRLHSDPKEFD